MADDDRDLNLPDNPVGNRLYEALTGADALSAQDAGYVGAALGRIEQRMPESATEAYELYTDENVDTQLWVTRDGQNPVVQEYEKEEDDADIKIFGSAFEAGIHQLFEDAAEYRQFKKGYETYSPHQAEIR